MRVWPPEWGTLMYNYTSECRSHPIVLANCWVSECMLGVRQTVSWLQMPAILLWDEAVQNATEILTLKCSTQKTKLKKHYRTMKRLQTLIRMLLRMMMLEMIWNIITMISSLSPVHWHTSIRIYLKDQKIMDSLLVGYLLTGSNFCVKVCSQNFTSSYM